MVWEDEEKFQKFQPCRLQGISIWIDKNPFGGLMKNWAATLHKVTFLWKNVPNSIYSLDSFFKASWLHAWKFSDHLELYNIYEKIISRKK